MLRLVQIILVVSIVLIACSKENVDSDDNTSNNEDSSIVEDTVIVQDTIEEAVCDSNISYGNSIKRIIDNSCAVSSCHTNGYFYGDFSSYYGLESRIQDTTGSIYQRVVVRKDMPISGYTMTQEQRDSVACWIKNGAKEN